MWRELPVGRFAELLGIVALASALAWPWVRWRGWRWANALALTWLAAAVVMTGPAAWLAVAALAFGAAGAGYAVLGHGVPGLFALMAGLAVVGGVAGWLLPVPLHFRWTYLLLLAGLALWQRGAIGAALQRARQSWQVDVAAAPSIAAWSIALVGIASAGAWLPTMQHDDLGYHLALPWQLMTEGRYHLDPTHQLWALAPWFGDVLQAVVQVIAGGEARGPLNLLWLALTLAAMRYVVVALRGSAATLWLSCAVAAGLPLTAALLGGMQTEVPATAVTVAIAAWGLRGMGDARGTLLLGGLLLGMLLALKPMHVLAASPLLVWGFWRNRASFLRHPGALVAALLLAVAVGGSSYFYAYLIAGNPVLPLFNSVFNSPFAPPGDFIDPRWATGLHPLVIGSLTFETSRYLEGWNGGMGFLLVAGAGAWVLAILHPPTRALAVCASAAVLLPLVPMQYARYLHPGVVLLVPALLVTMQAVVTRRQHVVLVLALCALHLAFQPNANWFLHTGAIKRSVLALGRDAPLLERYVPERQYIAGIRARDGNAGHSHVLTLDRQNPSQAELGRRGLAAMWYSPTLDAEAQAADGDASGRAWAALLARHGVGDVLLRPTTATPAQLAGLALAGGRLEAASDDAQWWRLPAAAHATAPEGTP